LRKRSWDETAPVFTDKELEQEMEKYRDTMFNIIDRARKNKKEYGFTLCWDDDKNKTYMLEICEGEQACVNIKRCQYPDQFASIHVHPRGSGWVPSPLDIVGALQDSDALFCIGVVGHGKMRDAYQCYEPTENPKTTRKYIDAHWNDDYETLTDMSIEALINPSKDTVYRPVFKMVRKY
jgi:hypothetical protein